MASWSGDSEGSQLEWSCVSGPSTAATARRRWSGDRRARLGSYPSGTWPPSCNRCVRVCMSSLRLLALSCILPLMRQSNSGTAVAARWLDWFVANHTTPRHHFPGSVSLNAELRLRLVTKPYSALPTALSTLHTATTGFTRTKQICTYDRRPSQQAAQSTDR